MWKCQQSWHEKREEAGPTYRVARACNLATFALCATFPLKWAWKYFETYAILKYEIFWNICNIELWNILKHMHYWNKKYFETYVAALDQN